MDYTANMRRPRVDYTPVMFQNAWQSVRNAARSASKNPATKKAKNFVKDVAEGVAEKHGKQAGKDLLKQLQQTTPERQQRDVQIPDMSPLSKSPIRTPRKSAREQRKRQLMDWERWREHHEQKRQEEMQRRHKQLQMSPGGE